MRGNDLPGLNVPVDKRDTGQGERLGRGKKYQPEQVVNLLRQIEVAVANGKSTVACRWTSEAAEGVGAGELQAEAPGCEPESGHLVLKDFASGNFPAFLQLFLPVLRVVLWAGVRGEGSSHVSCAVLRRTFTPSLAYTARAPLCITR